MSNRLAGCQSLFCAWCGLMRPTRSVTHASVGLSGSATQRPIWLRLLWDTLCASGRSMGIALTNRLLWETPRLRTPEQFERWSHMVAVVHNHLVLARDLVQPELRPWENKQRQPTPQQVRRGMHKLLARLGTPARIPQPRGKSKGRRSGIKIGKAMRFSVVRKTPKLPPLVPI